MLIIRCRGVSLGCDMAYLSAFQSRNQHLEKRAERPTARIIGGTDRRIGRAFGACHRSEYFYYCSHYGAVLVSHWNCRRPHHGR